MVFCRVKKKYECFEKVKLLHSVRLNVFPLNIKKTEELKKKNHTHITEISWQHFQVSGEL